MKRFVLPVLLLIFTQSVFATSQEIAQSFLIERHSLQAKKIEKGLTQAFMISTPTLDLASLEIVSETLAPGATTKKRKNAETHEELLIVFEGQLQINGDKQQYGPGSVMVNMPGEKRRFTNAGDAAASYYLFRYRSHNAPNPQRAKKAGGSILLNWDEIDYMPSDIGGRRNFFDRPTAMFDTFEMHVSTLNGGLTNHPAHTHRAEEFVLIMEGRVAMLLGEKTVEAGAGDLIYVESMIPHSLNNIGKEATTYFAFQFWQ